MAAKTLIFIPTYNEQDNVLRMCEEIHRLGLDVDVLFVDDNSPDGTGQLLEGLKARFPRLLVHHRTGKHGVGSAHYEAIQWAYDQDYQIMVTMDCDFTHSPSDIPAMLRAAEDADVAVGSRWAQRNSLVDWNLFRRCMTGLGHVLTRTVLDIPQDASGAFRAYRLDRLPREVFKLVRSRGYAFFFESLFILNRNGFAIAEVPIVLLARTYGHSKMTLSAAMRSARFVFELYLSHLRNPEDFLLPGRPVTFDKALLDPQGWDAYWETQTSRSGLLYELIAGLYRRGIIARNLDRAIKRTFPAGATLLHAGCGSGQADAPIQRFARITGLDISPAALRRFARNVPNSVAIRHGSIFALPFPDASFDGVYNLGVMEHFSPEEINRILAEFHRVLKPDGKIVIFWPHRWATSVMVLGFAHFLLNTVLRKDRTLHAPEVTLSRNRRQAQGMLARAGFALREYRFGWRDIFVQAVIVGAKEGGSRVPASSEGNVSPVSV